VPDRAHAEAGRETPETDSPRDGAAAPAFGAPLSPRAVLALQRAAGNAAVTRLLQRQPWEPEADPGIRLLDYPNLFSGNEAEELQAKPGNDAPATPAQRQAAETASNITLRDGDTPWTRFDLIDLGAAMGALGGELPVVSGVVFQRFTTEAAKTAVLGGSSAAAAAQTFVRSPTDRIIAIWNQAFDHPTSSGGVRFTGKTVHGVNQGVYCLVHEVGHLIEIPRQAMIERYKPVEAADKAKNGEVSTQPQAKNADVRERFAEAYARFKVDSADLKTGHPGIHAFFTAGSHMR